MIKKIIYLLRHGDKKDGIGDVSLSSEGVIKVKKTALFLLSKKIDYIYTSPSSRCLQTAKIINHFLKKKIKIDIRLKERINFGENEVNSYKDYKDLCCQSTFNRNLILPNGKTSITAGKRFKEVINNILIRSHTRFLIISHGGIIADFLRNEFEDNYLDSLNPFFKKYKIVDFCSITVISIDIKTKNIKLLTLNNLNHLL